MIVDSIMVWSCFLFPKQQGLQRSILKEVLAAGCFYFQNNKDYNQFLLPFN